MSEVDLTSLIERIGRKVVAAGLKIGTAESCTGGAVGAEIAKVSGVSAWFMGGVISYAREVKIEVLSVPKHIILTHGEVSRPTAAAMARGARAALGCDWAVSITGIAGPDGGSMEKPVGTVVFGISGPALEDTSWQAFSGDRAAIQRASVKFALEYLARGLGA